MEGIFIIQPFSVSNERLRIYFIVTSYSIFQVSSDSFYITPWVKEMHCFCIV
jgi:hypothetical protein